MDEQHLKASVYAIDRLRIGVDGDGIRTLILLGGCPLKCKYCINPETWQKKADDLTLEMLYERVCIDGLYFEATNGGVTFGGGEPLLQAAYIRKFHDRFCYHWTMNIETSLNVPEFNLETVLPVTNHFYVDIKTLDPALYFKYTGKKPELAFHNLKHLISSVDPGKYTVRIPVIPGMKSEEIAQEEADRLLSGGVENIDVFEYIIS